jgi:hypothetical protein
MTADKKDGLEKSLVWRKFAINISLIIVLFLMGIFMGFVIRTERLISEQNLTTARAHFNNIVLTQLSGFIAKLFFDKPTHCRAVSIMASKKTDAVFSQKLPRSFNWSAARVNIR